MWLSYPLSYGFTGFISSIFCILILTQYKSLFSTYTILFIRSITPTPFFLFLSLKNSVFKLLIRGVLYPDLIWWLLLFLMPPIRSLASKCCTYTVAVILLLGKIMPFYSYCKEKKLVYIAIIIPFSCQPSSCIKCIKLNMCSSCNIKLMSDAEYV